MTDGISTLHPRTNQIQHSEQPPTLITTRANFKGEMLQILIIDTVGPVPIYRNRPSPIQVQWTGCGLDSVPRLVITLNLTTDPSDV